jgi:S1-C subfamily serine protease
LSEWDKDTRQRPRRGNGIYLVIILLMVVNVAVLYYSTTIGPRSTYFNELEQLNTEIEDLRFQISSLQLDISNLRDELKISGNNITVSESIILTQLYNQTRKSVVLISITSPDGGGTGSGFVYDDQGHIITNNHVIEDATSIEVTFLDGSILEAELVGADPYSDMAVIKVEAPEMLLYPLELGESSDLLVGDTVVAIGNPFGLENTMTAGIVSAVGRQLGAVKNYIIVDVIQTDAAINPGNSGGPLLNLQGEVVGMNTAILSETRQFSGIGFAIPSDTITREVDYLIGEGEYEHPYLGISGLSITPGIAEAMNLDRNTRGTLVVTVENDGPADNAGLEGGTRNENINGVQVKVGGDVIIGVDGKTMKTFYDLILYISRNKRPGDTITLSLIRDGDVTSVDLTLGVRPEP